MGANSGGICRIGRMNSQLGSEPVIRLAQNADADAIVTLQKTLFPGDINHVAQDKVGADFNGRYQPLIIVAELADVIAGFLVLRNRPARPWTSIDFVGVAPHVSGRGIGGQMLDAAVCNSPRPFLRLFVRPSNAGAVSLYVRNRFRHIATRKANYPDGEDAWIFMKWVGFRAFHSNASTVERPK